MIDDLGHSGIEDPPVLWHACFLYSTGDLSPEQGEICCCMHILGRGFFDQPKFTVPIPIFDRRSARYRRPVVCSRTYAWDRRVLRLRRPGTAGNGSGRHRPVSPARAGVHVDTARTQGSLLLPAGVSRKGNPPRGRYNHSRGGTGPCAHGSGFRPERRMLDRIGRGSVPVCGRAASSAQRCRHWLAGRQSGRYGDGCTRCS
jgi:hypothetical protein